MNCEDIALHEGVGTS